MDDPDPSIINLPSSIRALSALRDLGFTDGEQVLQHQGPNGAGRVLAAVAYVASRRNIRRPGVYVRRLLEQKDKPIPAPLVWPDAQGEWETWHSLNGQRPTPAVVPMAGTEPAAKAFWREVLERLRSRVTVPLYETWLKKTAGYRLEEGKIVVAAQDDFTAEWMNTKLLSLCARVASGLADRPVEVEIVIWADDEQ